MHRVPRALLLASLVMGCDSTQPTDSSSALGARPRVFAGEELSETALLVGNFIPQAPGNAILRYTADGAFVDVMVDLGLPGGPRGGCCMAFGIDENLYTTAVGGAIMPGRVNRFNGVTGEFIDEFVPPGTGGLSRPLGITLGPDGNLYVGDIGSPAIRRYDGRTGAPLGAIGDAATLGGAPQLFVFGADDDLYVVVPDANAVQRFDGTSGAFLGTFVTGPAEHPIRSGLAVGPDGDLYVGVNHGVNRYDGQTGALIDEFIPQESGGLSVPVGMVFGPDGDLYVASPGPVGDGSVLRFDGETGAFIEAVIPSTEPHITGPRMIEFKSTITMCHRPPGNPLNQKSISTGYLTASDHVRHGDLVGACPWSTPVNLGAIVNSDATELEVTISRDGRSLYIASNRSGNFDIWVSRRASVRDAWGQPRSIGPVINTPAREQGPYLSRDGRELYFFSDRPGSDGLDIWRSQRSNPNDDFGWGTPVHLGTGVNSSANESLPVLFEDEAPGTATLYFTRSPPNDIYASTRQSDATFGAATVVAELSSSRRDRVLSIRRDGLEIFLASDRPGPTPAPFDLWVATRATAADPWSAPVNLGPPVNGASSDEGGAALSFDGRTLYLASNRPGSLEGSHDIWVTTRATP